MTYPPYPAGGSSQLAARPGPRPPRPQTLVRAVWLMRVGAALSAAGVLTTLAYRHRIEAQFALASKLADRIPVDPRVTLRALPYLIEGAVVALAVAGLLAMLAWLWMASAAGAGNWSRIVATVLYAVNTLALTAAITHPDVLLVSVSLGWLAGTGALVLLWHHDTAAYIRARRQQQRPDLRRR